ncbi:hypothetical protein B0J15DRAFT_555817 [Fusarium solani]|uniref:Uncharacterized protein n=1 Tax=Fusarium solani TaxID=169388 RepID=A0A9P9G416_FUSSL|nr:uncharacterized protein B0J15DRAFT_555817 [Fusarium solani]KAH7230827.1 hypothetical protein B0J15DRAFT_555817 [Fusarium solani]
MANAPSNISDFSNPESTYTAFHRAHPEQQANFNSKLNETAAEFFQALPDMRGIVFPGAPYIQFGQQAPAQAPTQAPAPAPAPIPALGATAPTAPNPALVAPTSMPNTNYSPAATTYSAPTASIQSFAPIAHPQVPAATSIPQPYATTPVHAIAPTVSATVPPPTTPQYTHELAEAEREWLSMGGQ